MGRGQNQRFHWGRFEQRADRTSKYFEPLVRYRKNSKAIQEGKLIHFAPFDGVYVLYRAFQDEEVVLILNKNENEFKLDLDRFKELQLEGKAN